MAHRRRRQHSEAEGGHERWLISYADMITLLFALFIVLYAMSKLNESKFQQLSHSLARAITHQDDAFLPGTIPPKNPDAQGKHIQTGNAMSSDYETTRDAPKEDEHKAGYDDGDQDAEDAELEKLAEQVEAEMKAAGMPGVVHTQVQEAGLVIRLVEDRILFRLGDAEVSPDGKRMVHTLARVIKGVPNAIRIEGNTDNIPINGGRFHSNWELSTMRATNVAEVMIVGDGIPPERVSVLGHGEFRPLVPNTSDANRQINRRVEVVLLRMRPKKKKHDN